MKTLRFSDDQRVWLDAADLIVARPPFASPLLAEEVDQVRQLVGFATVTHRYGLAHDGKVNDKGMLTNLKYVGAVARLSEMRSANLLLTLIQPLILWLGKRAEKDGTLDRLVEKYCR